MRPGGEDLSGDDGTDADEGQQPRSDLADQLLELALELGRLPLTQARARRAVARMAMTVARSSAL